MTSFPRASCLPLLAALVGGCLDTGIAATEASTETSSSSGDGSSSGGPMTTDASSTTGVATTEASPTTATSIVPTGECGDMVVDPGEECDDGPANGDEAACTPTCLRNTCGDGLVWVGHEACDDGPANADDGACTPECDAASCGDGKVQAGVEVCDDGVNDGSYGSCAADCSARAAHCGDGTIDPDHEECDSGTDPACLGSCQLATSCLRIHESDPSLISGPRQIYPFGPVQSFDVYCDMETDGGGYTFLKVDVDSDVNDLPYTSKKAEGLCAGFGMRLFVPRSPAHLASAFAVATTPNVAPQGGGDNATGQDYLQILGIYPVKAGISCLGKALTPSTCPQWSANDGGARYVSPTVKNPPGPDGDGACASCSMIYTWNLDGSVKNYKTVAGAGGISLRFMCDVGDKLPP